MFQPADSAEESITALRAERIPQTITPVFYAQYFRCRKPTGILRQQYRSMPLFLQPRPISIGVSPCASSQRQKRSSFFSS